MKTPPALRGGRFHSKVAFCHEVEPHAAIVIALGGCGSSLQDTRESRLVRYAGNQRQRPLSRCERCGSMSRMRALNAAQKRERSRAPAS